MAQTKQSIILEKDIIVSLNALSNISPSEQIFIHNIGSSDVYVFVNAGEPELDDDNFQVIKPNSIPFVSGGDGIEVWALSANQGAKVNIARESDLAIAPYMQTKSMSAAQMSGVMLEALMSTNEALSLILNELKLLNARAEEAWETKINIEDVSDADSRY